MLKSKKAISVLLLVNVFIWGYFIYRFYSLYNETEPAAEMADNTVKRATARKDSAHYVLNLNYSDPFLKNSGRSYSQVGNSPGQTAGQNVVQVKVPKLPPPAANMPEIKFMGLIKNTSSGASAALITINGQSKVIKQNETVEGVQFKSLTRDSLVARFGQNRLTVKR